MNRKLIANILVNEEELIKLFKILRKKGFLWDCTGGFLCEQNLNGLLEQIVYYKHIVIEIICNKYVSWNFVGDNYITFSEFMKQINNY